MMESLLMVSVATVSAGLTYFIHTKWRLNPVLVSAAIALLVSSLCESVSGSGSKLVEMIPFVSIGGTFVGMSTKKKVKTIYPIFIAGFVFSLLFIRSSSLFEGFGGALGISACVSVLAVTGMQKVLKKTKVTVHKRKLRRSSY